MCQIQEYGGQRSVDPSRVFFLGHFLKDEVSEASRNTVEVQDNGWSLNIPPINIVNDFEFLSRELQGWHKLMHPAISQEERDAVFEAFRSGLQFHLFHNPARIDSGCNHVVLTASLSRRYVVVSNEALDKTNSWTEEDDQ